MSRLKTVVAFLIVATMSAPIHAQTEIDKLRADVARLRAELDALKTVVAGGKGTPDRGPRYRGQPIAYWLDQMKDFDAETRTEAVKAIGALAEADRKLITPLIDLLKKDSNASVLSVTATVLGDIGPDALPALIEFAKDKKNGKKRPYALEAIGYMGQEARPALPMLTAALKEPDPALLRGAIRALVAIGPEPKKVVPALVDALGDTLVDAGKPDTRGRFGTGRGSINYMLFDAVRLLDPDLVGDLTPPRVARFDGPAGMGANFPGGGGGKKGKAGGGNFPGGGAGAPGGIARDMTPQEFVSAWEKIHQSLVKRYVERK